MLSILSKILKSPYLTLPLVPLIWGSNFVIGKQLVETFPPFALTTGRFAVAFICLLPIYLFNRKKHWAEKITAKTWGLLIFLGITGVFAFNTLLYSGLRQTSPVNATLINAFNPTLTVLLSFFIIGEKLRGKQIAGLVLSFIGVAWIAVQGQPVRLSNLAFNPGDLIILGGALVWAVYSIGVKKVVTTVPPMVTTTLSIFFGLLLLFPAAYIESNLHPVGPISWKSILALIYLGVFPSVIAFWLWNRGIAQVGPGKASMFYNLLPPFTAVMSYLFLGEIPKNYHFVGGTLILWGVIWGTKQTGGKYMLRDIDNRILKLAKPYLRTRKNDIHTKIAYRFAVRLLESEPGDPEVVIPAILCHDLGWSKVPEDQQLKAFGPKDIDRDLQRVHEVEGVRLAREIFREVNYDSQKTAEILEIIDGHDSRLTAISDSDKIVKDADKLFRFEPVGLGIDVERFEVDMDEYTQLLREKIEQWFFTETARKLALEELAKTNVI